MTTEITDKKNLIVDTATQCNLLCKIIIDYMSNKKCHIVEDKTDSTNIKNYIQYEEGSFINYRDTNYEVDKVYFFSPSRHSVDGEKFDLEVNIHHGGERIIAHNHYHNDVEDTTPLRKHFHYHSKKDGDNNHHEAKQAGIKSEIVSCILFNIGEHNGSEVNVFFNQFVHKLDSKEPINVHSNWNIEQLLPKKKSYFMYEYKKGENDYNVIVFDNIQSIESGIFEIIKDKYFPPEDISSTDTALSNTALTNTVTTEKDTLKDASLFYRTNVEMITDEQYKKSKRDQIKDLLSIVRLNYMKDEVVSANEYIDGADKILAAATGTGSLSSFQDKQSTAIEVANLWNNWGQGVFSEITSSKIYKDVEQKDSDKKREYYKNMKFDDNIDYLSLFENKFKEQINNALNDFYKVDIDFFNPIEIEEKIKETNLKYNIDLYSLDTIRENLLKYNKIIKYSGWGEQITSDPSEDNVFTGSIEDYLSDFNIFNPEQMDYDIEINYNKGTDLIGSSYVYKPKDLISNTNTYEPDNEELIVKDKYILPKPDTYHKVYYTVKDLGNKLITKYFEDDDIKMSTKDNILRIWRFFINLNPDYQSKNLINLFGIQEFIFPLTIFYNDFEDTLSLQTFQIYHTPESIIPFLNNGETVVDPDIKMTFYGTNEDFIDENGEKLLANDILNKTLGNHNFKITLDTIDYESLSIKKYFGYYDMGETFFEELNFDDLSDGIPSFIFTFTPKFEIIIDNVFKFCDKNDFSFRVLVSAPEMDHTIDNEECQDWLSNEEHYEGSLWKFWETPPVFPKDGRKWDALTYKEKNFIRDGLLKAHKGDKIELSLSDTEAHDLNAENDSMEKGLKWFRHNKCRNPGNLKAGPWCYTKNPKRRWNYCVQPDYTKYIARIVLVCVFIMVGIVAIVFVKYLFRFEIISKIVAALTGANFASEAIFKANQTVNNIKTNVKSITG